MIELAFAGFEVREWIGVVAPARTPRDIVLQMAEEIARATSSYYGVAGVGSEIVDFIDRMVASCRWPDR
jgi:Tripartite tricarboxylate transporter family receptor